MGFVFLETDYVISLLQLSIPFMGFKAFVKNKYNLQLGFQFPLWDSLNITELDTFGNVIFQFPLWDSRHFRKYSIKRFWTFNSLYGIHPRDAGESQARHSPFQFPLWDSSKNREMYQRR